MTAWPPALSVRIAGDDGVTTSFPLLEGDDGTPGFRECLEASIGVPDGDGWALRVDDEVLAVSSGVRGRGFRASLPVWSRPNC